MNRVKLIVEMFLKREDEQRKSEQLKEVEKALSFYNADNSIKWEVLDYGDRQCFEITSWYLCHRSLLDLRDFMLVYDVTPFENIEPVGKNWYITFKNNYIAGDDPKQCIEKMIDFYIAKHQKAVERLNIVKSGIELQDDYLFE